jgi:hypothetical protein
MLLWGEEDGVSRTAPDAKTETGMGVTGGRLGLYIVLTHRGGWATN